MKLFPYETETTLINAKGEPVFAIIYWSIKETPSLSYIPWINVSVFKNVSFPVIESIEAWDTKDQPYTITNEDKALWDNSIQWEVSEHFQKIA